MRILIVSDYGYPAGGAELMIKRLRDELRRRGHDARMFTTNLSHSQRKNFADYHCFGTESRLRTLLQTANASAAARLLRLIRCFRPQIVHVRLFLTQLSPLILPVLRNVPSLYHVAWYRPICPTGSKFLPSGEPCGTSYGVACLRHGCLSGIDWPLLMLQMRAFRAWRHHFDRVVANSHAVRFHLEAEGIGPVDVVYNGIPVADRVPRRTTEPIVAFSGRLVPQKGVDVLLEAMKQVVAVLPGARLLVAGDGPERSRLEWQARATGLADRVAFLGWLPHDRLDAALRTAAVHVVPSRWAEPFGTVAVEAMMRGQAVIATDHGGLAEIISDGKTGELVPPGDPGALARSMIALLLAPQKAEAMGRDAYANAAERFSLQRFCSQFEEIYRQLLDREG